MGLLTQPVWIGRFPPRLKIVVQDDPPLSDPPDPPTAIYNAVPGLMQPGKIWPGQPAIGTGGGVDYLFSGGMLTPLIYLQYLDNNARTTLVAVSGKVYNISVASGVGFTLPVPPALGNWMAV
jgi:hypothetical protein